MNFSKQFLFNDIVDLFLESVKWFISFSYWMVRCAFYGSENVYKKANNFVFFFVPEIVRNKLHTLWKKYVGSHQWHSISGQGNLISGQGNLIKTCNSKLALKQELFCSLFPFDQQMFNTLSLLLATFLFPMPPVQPCSQGLSHYCPRQEDERPWEIGLPPVLVDNLPMKNIIIHTFIYRVKSAILFH